MLLRQTLLYLPAQLIGPFALFVAAVVWTHLLPPGAYGTLMLVMAAQELIFGFGLAWLSLTVLRYRDSFERGEGAARFRRAEAAMLYGSILLQALAVVVILPFFDRPTPQLIGVAAVFIVSRSLLNHLAERARAGGEIMWYTIAQTSGPLVGFLLSLLLTKWFGASPAVALSGYAIVQMIVLPFVWLRAGAVFKPAMPTRELVEPLKRYGMPLLLSSVGSWVAMNGIRLVVDKMQGETALGLMSVGWGLGQRLASTVAMLVTAAAFPMAVKAFNAGDRDGAMDQLAQNGVLLISLLAPTFAGLQLVDDELVKFMIAQPYWRETIAILPLAVLSGVVRNVRVHYADQVYLLYEKTNWLLVITATEAVATLVGAAVGASLNGVVGAVTGALIAHIVTAIVVFAHGMMTLGLRIRWFDLARIGVATIAMSFVVSLVTMDGSLWRLVFAIALGVAIYSAALMALFPEMIGKLRRAVAF
ncbi:lipopolysaccharide biosynthesis protein [Terrarubrum flagellatum]|uniref:lipopolysaccharide biosynthesis protein n=1 Tax=Terrirubrum flagellatum TaxID=2895980 RepID=UPI003145383B